MEMPRESSSVTWLLILVLLTLTSCPGDDATSAPPDQRHADANQRRLRAEFVSPEFGALYAGGKGVVEGGPFAQIIISKLNVDLIVVEGTTGDALQAGAGHYVGTAFPGQAGNVVIAGQRTQFGAPFRFLDRLVGGDQIVLVTPEGRHVYEVVDPFDGHSNPWVTHPRDIQSISPTTEAALTLTTSDPPHSSTNRLVVRLRLKT